MGLEWVVRVFSRESRADPVDQYWLKSNGGALFDRGFTLWSRLFLEQHFTDDEKQAGDDQGEAQSHSRADLAASC